MSVNLLSAHSGYRVPDTCLERFDGDLKGSLETHLVDELSNEAWQQALAGVIEGGLGFRSSAAIALPAFMASRVENKPAIE